MPATRHFITQCLRLLQLVLTNLALLRPILGCSPAVVQVASADGSVFEQWLHNGMASDARRPAHLMQAYVRGDMPSKADILPREHQPEAYNVDIGSSIQPAEYHLGYAAERIIRAHYVATHAGDHVFQRGTLLDLVDEAEGNVGVKFADGLKRWNLTWRTAAPGVILYKLRRLGVSAEDQAAAEAIKRAQDEGRWIDLTVKVRLDKAYQEAYDNDQWVEMTEAEMEPYAKQLEEAVDLIVGDRELMLELQDMVNVPIEIVGRIATDILAAELMRHLGPVKPKANPPAKVPPATVPRRAIPQNDNGVPSAPRAPAPPPRMTPPVYKPKKAA